MIKVLDNFLPNNEIEKIYYMHHNINWSLNIATVNRKSKDIVIDENTRDSFQFCCTHYDKKENIRSNFLSNVLSILDFAKVKYKSIHRIKSNLTTRLANYNDGFHQPKHTDYDTNNYFSFLYYVNDSDGDTFFFDDDNKLIKRVSPRDGRAVMFDSNISHAGSNPIHRNIRMVVNFVLEKM